MIELALSEVLLRTGCALAAGAGIGLEREVRGQLAGMRTHALVAVGAALFTLAGAYGFAEMARGANADPMRVASQVASGIGFIGAGAIIRDGGSTRGLTTAASLWASAAIGMSAGAGRYDVALIGASAILLTLVGLRILRDSTRVTGVRRHSLDIAYRRGHGTLGPIVHALDASASTIQRLEISDIADLRHVRITLRSRDAEKLRDRLGSVADRVEVESFMLERERQG